MPADPGRSRAFSLERGHLGRLGGPAGREHPGLRLEDPPVVVRDDADEADQARRPSRPAGRGRARCRSAPHGAPPARADSAASASVVRPAGASATISRLQRRANVPVLVEHIGDPARHPGREVAPRPAQHDHPPARHVLAAVVADALHDRASRPELRTANRSPASAADEGLAAGRAVERDVAGDDVLLGDERRLGRRVDHEPAAGEPLAEVVVGVALQGERDAARDERAEALPGRAPEVQADRVVGQAGRARSGA